MSPESELPWYVSLIISWLPFIWLALIGGWVGRKIRLGTTTKDGRTLADVLEELSRELKQSNLIKPSN
jgi:hypothetical protein